MPDVPAERPKALTEKEQGDIYIRVARAFAIAETLADLAAAWKAEQPAIMLLPHHWQQALTDKKDEAKARLKEIVGA